MSKNRKRRPRAAGSVFRRLFFPGGNDERSILEEEALQSPMRTVVRNFLENKIAVTGVVIFLLIFLAVMFLPFFYPIDLTYQDVTQQNISPGFSMMSVPKELQGHVAQIAPAATTGVGLSQDGKVYVWGKLNSKQKAVPKFEAPVVQIAAGMDHYLALDSKGKVYTWGNNQFALGVIPEDVKFPKSKPKQIAAGQQVSYVLMEDGTLYHWGNENLVSLVYDQYQGQIDKIVPNGDTVLALLKDGRIVALTNKDIPFARIPDSIGSRAVDIASTDKAAVALLDDGTLVGWGGGDYGMLDIPPEIQGKVKQVVAGLSHFTALLNDGSVVSWGRDNLGQTNVPGGLTNVQQVFAGYHQSYALMSDGTVKGWGLKGYLMGTDNYGRDVFIRLLNGGRMTMTIGAIAVIISTIVGVIIGGISGYYGGKLDNLLMRLTEIVMCIPFLPFAMILSALITNNVSEVGRVAIIMVILGLLSWPGLARLVRAQILAEREKEFVTAAKAMGIKEMSIVFKQILPNVITVIIVNTTLAFATCMLTESSLSFLGFGVVEPTPTWGNMLTGSQSSTVISVFWWRWVFPAIALGLCTISINSIGDGLRDAIDPRSNEK